MWAWILGLGMLAGAERSLATESGDSVVVVYNQQMPESKSLAEYYAARRQVPARQVLGFKLPTGETISRTDYQEQLEKPLLQALESANLFVYSGAIKAATSTEAGRAYYYLADAKIRYAVLCYGVPIHILNDTNLVDKGEETVRVELRRNEAAVDSELTLLPLAKNGFRRFGPIVNPVFQATNAAMLHPTNGVLMVARLDGPSVAIARGLVDKALEAEKEGLWGRAYFDARGLTNSAYKSGDDWIRLSASFSRDMGMETILDERPETFPPAFPMSQIALYAGWYEAQVSGPFTRPEVEFMPGAIAYHLHSFSAATVRTASQCWVGPLLAKGATATMGCVAEPYLDGTPHLAVFFNRLFFRFTFGEAACAAQKLVSWQTIAIGDPLYRPFTLRPEEQHAELARRQSRYLEWSDLRLVNLNSVTGSSASNKIAYLEHVPELRQSAVLQEKLASLRYGQGDKDGAVSAWIEALKLKPTPQQRIRLLLQLGAALVETDHAKQAYEIYRVFIRDFKDYPDPLPVYQELLALARKLGKTNDAEQYQRRLDLITGMQSSKATP